MDLTNIGVIKELMAKYGKSFSKSLGQNFLTNPTVCPKMAELCGTNSNVGVLEIGPGIGVLTKELAVRSNKVVAVELDSKLMPILSETLREFDNVKIIEGDVLKLDLATIIRDEFLGMDVVVCANLPYYITSPIIMRLLEDKLPIKSITAMVQKEVAERICAPIPSRELGAITVSIAYYADCEILFGVSKGSFMPSPKVDSSVIKLNILAEPTVSVLNAENFFRVVKAGFSQRRKTISNSLSAGLALDKAMINQLLEKCELSPSLRAEQLYLKDFANIENQFTKLQKQ